MSSPTRRASCALVLAAAFATAACTSTPTAPPTVRVDRGIVKTSVSASGTLVAITEQNLGFPNGGQLRDVNVKVGDRVQAGQVLATLDDFALAITLEQKKAMLAQQQAGLAKITNGNSVEAAQATLDQAQEIVDATQDQVDATQKADESATSSAERQLAFDRKTLDRAKAQLRADQVACAAAAAAASSSPAPAAAAGNSAANSGTDGAAGVAPTPTTEPSAPGSVTFGSQHGSEAGSQMPPAPAPPAGSAAPATSMTTTDPACQRVTTDQTAVQQAQGAVINSQAALDAAEQKEKVDEASGRLSIENAKQSLITAQNNSDSADSDKPADTDAAAAMVRDAQAQVQGAQRDVDNAVLKAPVAGVVSAINGTAGEFVGSASGATAQAPGSGAPLPDVAASSGSAGGAASAGSGATAAPGGGAFIVLNDVDSFQLVVPFEESDAAKVAANQPVDVTVDAVPGLTAPATVLALAPTGQQSSGIVNYNATIVLNKGDAKLRSGQTAEAAVTVSAKDNVLRVPSSTVRNEGGRSVVNVPGADGKPATTPFTPGVVGDEFTQVQSGLNEGQEVLLPQAQVTASPAAGGPPRQN